MRIHYDFIGHIDVYPALNDDEQRYLIAFAKSRGHLSLTGPYEVFGNPGAEGPAARRAKRRRSTGVVPQSAEQFAEPAYPCGWTPGWDGDCISARGVEEFSDPIGWLQYLIDHFLRPGAHAASSGLAYFDNFSFDHVLDGVLAGNRRGDGELFLIDVLDNDVRKTVVRRGDPPPWDNRPLPYEEGDEEPTISRRPNPYRAGSKAALKLVARSNGDVDN